MSKKIIIPYDTKQKVSKILNCSIDTVDRQLKEYDIKSHKPRDWMTNPKINLSKEQEDVLCGALLGDGCLNIHCNGAMFDCRCFNIPKEEVTNCVYWRQLDATRNSIQMVGQANFSHKELQGKSCNEIQEILHEQKGINWNDFPTACKRGTACRKVTKEVNIAGTMDTISLWELDFEMPILKGDGRKYVDDLIFVGD